jgi:hypothetical protein
MMGDEPYRKKSWRAPIRDIIEGEQFGRRFIV